MEPASPNYNLPGPMPVIKDPELLGLQAIDDKNSIISEADSAFEEHTPGKGRKPNVTDSFTLKANASTTQNSVSKKKDRAAKRAMMLASKKSISGSNYETSKHKR